MAGSVPHQEVSSARELSHLGSRTGRVVPLVGDPRDNSSGAATYRWDARQPGGNMTRQQVVAFALVVVAACGRPDEAAGREAFRAGATETTLLPHIVAPHETGAGIDP